MTLDELKTRVKIKVDEYTPDGVSHSFDDYLGPMIQEAADELSDKAPLHLMEPKSFLVSSTGDSINIRWDNDLAYIATPTDFARVYEVDFALWKHPVHKTLVVDHPDYKLQENEFTRAGYARPAIYLKSASIVDRQAPVKAMVCGKVAESAVPVTLLYVAYKDAVYMPDNLDEALTWLAASKVLQILEEPKQAKLAYDAHLSELELKSK